MSVTKPIPVVLCGKTFEIASRVVEHLKPEYEVIHVIMSEEAGNTDLAALLTGGTATMASPADKLGSANYSSPPAAIITGGGFPVEVWQRWYDGARADPDAKRVPWLRADTSRPGPPPGPELARTIPPRIKVALTKLHETEGGFEKDDKVLF